MKIVHNKQELQEALKTKGQKIRIEGPYAKEIAQKIQRRKKISKTAKVGGVLLLIGGLAAAPFTGGSSLAGSAAGAAAMGLTIGTVALSAGELAMILGAGVGLCGYAVSKGYKVKIGKDGVELDPK